MGQQPADNHTVRLMSDSTMYAADSRTPHGAAMRDAPTRRSWEKARRRVRVRLAVWSFLFVAGMAGSVVLTATSETKEGGAAQAGAALGCVAILWYPLALYATLGTLGRLRRAGVVLERFGWRYVPAVRKLSGAESTGVPVQLCVPADAGAEPGAVGTGGVRKHDAGRAGVWSHGSSEEEPGWSPSLLARSPVRWNRWNDDLEAGAWFAGDPNLGGVLALPGGKELMFITRRLEVQRMERSTNKRDHERLIAAGSTR